jgi:hypothetical protein
MCREDLLLAAKTNRQFHVLINSQTVSTKPLLRFTLLGSVWGLDTCRGLDIEGLFLRLHGRIGGA